VVADFDLARSCVPLIVADRSGGRPARQVGTAFMVAGADRKAVAIVTAAHVLSPLGEHEQLETFPSPADGSHSIVVPDTWKRHESLDIAAIESPSTQPRGFPIRKSPVRIETDLYTLEYSRALGEGVKLNTFSNVFRGGVVSREHGRDIGSDWSRHPELWRLSFPAPRGASGAPVFCTARVGHPLLVSMIVGQHMSGCADEPPIVTAFAIPAAFIADFLRASGFSPLVTD
jgi:hypothetical protein